MAVMGFDYKLRSTNLILGFLLTTLLILGYIYMNETTQRIQLQDEILLLERQSKQIFSEKSAIQQRTANLQEKLRKQVDEMKKMQHLRELETEEQNARYVDERNRLQSELLSKHETIEDLKSQYQLLKEQFDKLHSQMQGFERNQSRLLEKFSTQSTQCMSVIAMMKELCDKNKESSLRKTPKVENDFTFPGSIVGLPKYNVSNQTEEIPIVLYYRNTNETNVKPFFNPTFTESMKVEKIHTEVYRDSGSLNNNTEIIVSNTNNNEEMSLDVTQNLQNVQSENQKTKTTLQKSSTEISEELENQTAEIDYAVMENNGSLEADDDNGLNNKKEDDQEDAREENSYYENSTAANNKDIVAQENEITKNTNPGNVSQLQQELESKNNSIKATDKETQLENIDQEGNTEVTASKMKNVINDEEIRDKKGKPMLRKLPTLEKNVSNTDVTASERKIGVKNDEISNEQEKIMLNKSQEENIVSSETGNYEPEIKMSTNRQTAIIQDKKEFIMQQNVTAKESVPRPKIIRNSRMKEYLYELEKKKQRQKAKSNDNLPVL
ncbi:Golgi membrane protein 1-like [Bombina bombina]|uniref:Golgi membrane protein 1-like n=1 Tax=Bombina bombina TaxID=8345 RepID=UPI00235B2ABC|nr:Golgi membrane protein 1-like [Bombina bombina]